MPMAPATHGAERQPGAPAVEYYASGAYLQIHPTVQDDEAPWKAGQVVALLAKHQIVPHRLLDVGCGPGGVLDILVSRAFPGAIGVGYDVAPDAIHRAERRRVGNEALTFHCGDVTAEELESQVYDVLLCLDVFEHVDDYIGFLRRL
ncbi:MAG: Methyltransferase type 12, partial [Geminicoccaceae bacterium]|nr:Methyltransferase type 12 [Geminicoccaceae bacterium]